MILSSYSSSLSSSFSSPYLEAERSRSTTASEQELAKLSTHTHFDHADDEDFTKNTSYHAMFNIKTSSYSDETFDLDMNWRHCIYLFGGIIIFSSKGIQQSICIEFDWSQQFKFWHIILLFMSHQIENKTGNF